MGNKPKQLEISVQGCGLVGMREKGCDALNICNIELFRKPGAERCRGETGICMKTQLESSAWGWRMD